VTIPSVIGDGAAFVVLELVLLWLLPPQAVRPAVRLTTTAVTTERRKRAFIVPLPQCLHMSVAFGRSVRQGPRQEESS